MLPPNPDLSQYLSFRSLKSLSLGLISSKTNLKQIQDLPHLESLNFDILDFSEDFILPLLDFSSLTSLTIGGSGMSLEDVRFILGKVSEQKTPLRYLDLSISFFRNDRYHQPLWEKVNTLPFPPQCKVNLRVAGTFCIPQLLQDLFPGFRESICDRIVEMCIWNSSYELLHELNLEGTQVKKLKVRIFASKNMYFTFPETLRDLRWQFET